MGEGAQPVLWLKHNKSKLYEKYAEESKRNGRRTISRTMFYQGLEAGNFKELKEMAGLCNICREYRAENFENLLKCADRFKELKEMAGLCNICREYKAENFENLLKCADRLETEWNTDNGKNF